MKKALFFLATTLLTAAVVALAEYELRRYGKMIDDESSLNWD